MRLKISRKHKIKMLVNKILDVIWSPVINNLTDEEYFACRTRLDCLKAVLSH